MAMGRREKGKIGVEQVMYFFANTLIIWHDKGVIVSSFYNIWTGI